MRASTDKDIYKQMCSSQQVHPRVTSTASFWGNACDFTSTLRGCLLPGILIPSLPVFRLVKSVTKLHNQSRKHKYYHQYYIPIICLSVAGGPAGQRQEAHFSNGLLHHYVLKSTTNIHQIRSLQYVQPPWENLDSEELCVLNGKEGDRRSTNPSVDPTAIAQAVLFSDTDDNRHTSF